MFSIWKCILAGGLWLLAAPGIAATIAPEGAKVYIISPENGAQVSGPVTVIFGLKNMGVAPAGAMNPGTGHHHLLIDVTELPPMDLPLPKDDHHMHFGGGQTEVVLNLSPGPHSVQLIMGDANHIPHQPPVISEKVNFTVK